MLVGGSHACAAAAAATWSVCLCCVSRVGWTWKNIVHITYFPHLVVRIVPYTLVTQATPVSPSAIQKLVIVSVWKRVALRTDVSWFLFNFDLHVYTFWYKKKTTHTLQLLSKFIGSVKRRIKQEEEGRKKHNSQPSSRLGFLEKRMNHSRNLNLNIQPTKHSENGVIHSIKTHKFNCHIQFCAQFK